MGEVGPSLTALLERLRFLLAHPVDFYATDTDSILSQVQLLAAAATYFNILVISGFGGGAGPLRSEGLLEQAVGAAFQTYGGEDPHPTPFAKASMLLRGITQGHPFNDGNKRTGFLTAAYYLTRIGYPIPQSLDVDKAERLCLAISSGDIRDVEAITEELRQLWG